MILNWERKEGELEAEMCTCMSVGRIYYLPIPVAKTRPHSQSQTQSGAPSKVWGGLQSSHIIL